MKTFSMICLITVAMLTGSAQAQPPGPAYPGAGIESGLPDRQDSSAHELWCILCAAPGGIGTLKNGAIVMVNDYVCKLLGYSREELLGQNDRMLYPDAEEYALARDHQERQAARYEPGSVETRWRTKDGRVLDVLLFAAPLEPSDPSSGIVFTVQDISARKQADRSVRQRARHLHEGAVGVAVVLAVLLFLLKRNVSRIKQSEQELKTFKETLETATDAIGMSTPRGRHYYQNRAFDALFGHIEGYPPDTLYVDPDVGRDVFTTIMSGSQWTGEVKMYAHDRRILDIHLRAYANKDKNGTIISLVGIHTDITNRRRAELALRESEQKVSNILSTIDDVVMSYSFRENRMVYLSPSLERVFGVAVNDHENGWHLGMSAVHPDDLQKIFDDTAHLHEQGFSDEEFRIIRPDKSIAWVRSRSKIIYTETGEPDRLDRIMTDITKRKQTELALRESEAKLAALFSSMTEMVVLHDLVFEEGRPVNYRITDCNSAFTEITGIARETAVGRLATEVYGTDTPPYIEEFSRVALSGESYRFETHFPSMGKHFSVSVVCPGENRFATITTDITRRKQSEEEHTRLQAQLIQAQKIESIGRLAGGVAHDFNNILSVILGYTDMALEHVGPDQPLRADLIEIRNAVQRSSKLTRQLLTFARRQPIAPRLMDLNETVEEMLKMLRRLIGEDIDLAWLPGKNLQPVRMDPSQLDQVLANLCVNARDAIAGVGRVTIETGNASVDEAFCARHPDCLPGDYVMLAVSDDGCGMDREILNDIFDPFFTTKDVGTGTGLGLSTVYGIVKQNNGCINVYSEPGHGTRFTIYLPRYVDGVNLRPDPAEPKKIVARGTETILLAEDEPANLEMFRRMLTELGYTVLAAPTPEACIRLAREQAGCIDLLMTDVVMPDMNGRDLADTIRAGNPEIKCLFMSGYTDKAITRCGVLEPGIEFIQKPFTLQEIAARVREVLDGRSEA